MSALLRIVVVTLAILACSQGDELPGAYEQTGADSYGTRNHGNHNHGNPGNRFQPGTGSHGNGFPGVATPIN